MWQAPNPFSFQPLVKGGFVFPSFLSLFVVCVVFRLRYQKSEQIFTSLENGETTLSQKQKKVWGRSSGVEQLPLICRDQRDQFSS